MRPCSRIGWGIAFALALAGRLSSFVSAQTVASQAAGSQTGRQALIEMLFGEAPGHLEKHLPDLTRQTIDKLKQANGSQGSQGIPGMFSLLAAQSKAGGAKFETFDSGATFFSIKEPAGITYEKIYATVERDEMAGGEDQIELALHMISDGKEENLLPIIFRLTFVMKLESGVWRLNEVRGMARFPLADPVFLKALVEHQFRQNEEIAVMSVRQVINAEKSYQFAQGSFSCTLSDLGTAGKAAGATKRIYLYDQQLAGGKKSGYTFTISGCDASHYRVVAEPEVADAGLRAYCSDESGTVRSSVDGKAATCLASGEVVKEKFPAVQVGGVGARSGTRTQAPTQTQSRGNAGSGTSEAAGRVSIAKGVAAGLIISKVQPDYPPMARQARVQGTVVMKAVINQTGDVESVELLSGHPMLVQAALDAVKQWKYRPYLLNGNAVAVETQVTVNFTLSEQ
jgi:TonB family protein